MAIAGVTLQGLTIQNKALFGRGHDAASAANSGILSNEQRRTNTASIGVKLEMPLYSGGRVSAGQREVSHRYLQTKEEYRQVRQDVLNKLRQQFRASVPSG